MAFGKMETWKVVYNKPAGQTYGHNYMGVALVEATCRADASFAFQQQYAGQFSTIQTIEKLLG